MTDVITKAQADADAVAAKRAEKAIEAKAEAAEVPALVVKMEAPVSTSKNEAVKEEDSAEKKEEARQKKIDADKKKSEVPVVSSVAQLRDAGLAKGTAPTTEQVAEMRKIEDKANEELSKQTRLPDAQQGKK